VENDGKKFYIVLFDHKTPVFNFLKPSFNIAAYPENRLWQPVSEPDPLKSPFFPWSGKCFLQKVKIFKGAAPKRGV
jgi:hypothetical protein